MLRTLVLSRLKLWEGEAPAEPKLVGKSAGREKNGSEWRIATGETEVNGN
jgi:hypothetical protein